MATSNTQTGGIGFSGLLAVAFIVMKLTGIISWSWWWVLSPIWIPFSIVLFVLFGGLLLVGISAAFGSQKVKSRRAY